MALSIHTNYSSLITQTNLTKTNNALGTNQQRLGTGYRINSAADDAAGLQIATRLNAQSRGMDVAIRNTNDAVSLLQTAEGAFQEMTDIVQRMKDLATQAANDTNSADDRTALQSEYDELAKELYNIVANTKYAGASLFAADDGKIDGDAGKFGATAAGVVFQIGASSSETLTVDISTTLKTLIGATSGGIGKVTSIWPAVGPATSGWPLARATVTEPSAVSLMRSEAYWLIACSRLSRWSRSALLSPCTDSVSVIRRFSSAMLADRPLISVTMATRCSCRASICAWIFWLRPLKRWLRLLASLMICWRSAAEPGVALASLSAAKNRSRPTLMLEPSPAISPSSAVRYCCALE